ncbi:MAG: hypothetical protein OXR62_06060 [Ahrensia sp.]|nr:hypothetical protein [Ahrensia sp.]
MINRRNLLLVSTAVPALALVTATFMPMDDAWAGQAIFTGSTDGIAINGYDPVAYFKQNAPVEGSADYTTLYKGVTWRFSSAENRDLFIADPEKYEPQYGGYCAYAVAKNQLAKTEPDAFSIVDGKLYLNFDKPVRSIWEAEKGSFIVQGDANWPDLNPG